MIQSVFACDFTAVTMPIHGCLVLLEQYSGPAIACRFCMVRESSSFNVTWLTLHVREKTVNDRLLFGRPIDQKSAGKHASVHHFKTDQIFGFVRWRGNSFGTQTWRVVVAQAGRSGERLTRIPGVKPGAHLLLHAFGTARANRALRAIDVLADQAVLHDVAPAYWRHVHLQISKNLPIEPYDPEAFAALDVAKSVR